MSIDDKFEIYDKIGEINKNSRTIMKIPFYEVDNINIEIFEEARKVDIEFRMKNANSNESAGYSYITF